MIFSSKSGKPALVFGDQLRIEGPGPIARHRQRHLRSAGQNRLLRIAVAVIGFALGALAIQMLVELGVQNPLRKRLLQLVDQPILVERRVAAKTIRLRDKEHRIFVSHQPCLLCGPAPADPHHLRLAQPRALGRKVSDEFTVPVCRMHHREIHRHGDEAAWWKKAGIEPMSVALTLWRQTHHWGHSRPQIGEDAIGASPTEHPPRAGEVPQGEIDETKPFPEVGQQWPRSGRSRPTAATHSEQRPQ